MTDLKRSIRGVALLVATDDRVKAAEVSRVLDAAMAALSRERGASRNPPKDSTVEWLSKMFGMR